jgi:hypothetical protein
MMVYFAHTVSTGISLRQKAAEDEKKDLEFDPAQIELAIPLRISFISLVYWACELNYKKKTCPNHFAFATMTHQCARLLRLK